MSGRELWTRLGLHGVPLRGMTTPTRGFALLCATVLLSASPCFASHLKTPPDSFADSPASWFDADGWKLLLGSPCSDTLDAPGYQVLQAAETALRDDDWILESGHAGWEAADAGRRVVTAWKPIHNFIFRLLAGRSVARCFASVTRIRDGRTQLTFQGGLAARHDLAHSAMRSLAERSYRSAVHDFQRDVRVALSHVGQQADATRPGLWRNR